MEERSQPIGVVIVDKIPLTNFGKVDVKALSEEYKDYDYLKE